MTIHEMVEAACDRIQQALPQDHEIDDITCEGNVFQIGIFDTTICPGGSQVGLFRFSRRSGESEEETDDRFNAEISEYIKNWRN